MSREGGRVVCVTGGSGFIGSELVRQLLNRGYTVHATVQDLKNGNETRHLEALEGAESRLRLFQMDLLHYDSIFAAINGVSGVFHVASPCVLQVRDPEREILAPAIEGTKNVLKAAKELGIGRVVITSSFSTIIPNYQWPSDVVLTEDCWSDVDYCRQKGLWYSVSKNLAEKAAWKFAKEEGLDVVVVIPGAVLGPILSPSNYFQHVNAFRPTPGCVGPSAFCREVFVAQILVKGATLHLYETNGSGRLLLHPTESLDLLKTALQAGSSEDYCPSRRIRKMVLASYSKYIKPHGCPDTLEDFFGGVVHVKDVALAHILLYENKSASGRHFCIEAVAHFGDFAAKVAELYPDYNVPSLPRDTQRGLLRDQNASKKLMDLGLQFIPMEQIIKDSVESLKSKGFIS